MAKENDARSLKPFIDPLVVGAPIGHLNLTLVPLRGEGRGHLEYLLAAEALRSGLLIITEINEGGVVRELLATSTAKVMILLLDGEELIGAKQNRILNTTILLPPQSKTRIPVSCVEQGRWRHTSAAFSTGGYAPAGLRALKSRDVSHNLLFCNSPISDQGAVWEGVDHCLQDAELHSPTSAMHDVIEKRRETLGGYVKALPYPEGSCGVMAAINGRLAATDVFDQNRTLETVWSRLLTGYAIDASTQRREQSSSPFTEKGAREVLTRVGELPCIPCSSVGIGEDWRFEAPDLLGQALVAENTCVHLSIFPNVDNQSDEIPGSPIQSPSSRRRRRMG